MIFIGMIIGYLKALAILIIVSIYLLSVIVSPVTIVLSLCGMDIPVWITIASTSIALLVTSWHLRERL